MPGIPHGWIGIPQPCSIWRKEEEGNSSNHRVREREEREREGALSKQSFLPCAKVVVVEEVCSGTKQCSLLAANRKCIQPVHMSTAPLQSVTAAVQAHQWWEYTHSNCGHSSSAFIFFLADKDLKFSLFVFNFGGKSKGVYPAMFAISAHYIIHTFIVSLAV